MPKFGMEHHSKPNKNLLKKLNKRHNWMEMDNSISFYRLNHPLMNMDLTAIRIWVLVHSERNLRRQWETHQQELQKMTGSRNELWSLSQITNGTWMGWKTQMANQLKKKKSLLKSEKATIGSIQPWDQKHLMHPWHCRLVDLINLQSPHPNHFCSIQVNIPMKKTQLKSVLETIEEAFKNMTSKIFDDLNLRKDN